LAVLDVIMGPEDEPEDRYFRFEPDGVHGFQLASMYTGSGDDYYIAFDAAAVFGWGFAHESAMTPFALEPVQVWPGVLDGIPAQFEPLLHHPRFMLDGVFMASTAFWSHEGEGWHAGSSTPPEEDFPDGFEFLFELLLDDTPEAYVAFALEYYEVTVDLEAVRAIYAMEPLTSELVARVNPEADYSVIRHQAEAIGYPLA
jgi:hypothetical protein